MRIWGALAFIAYVVREVLVGSWRVARWAWGSRAYRAATPPPAIVEFPLRLRSDLAISVLASCITITPGTMVVGLAAAEGETPPTLFVHAAFGGSRAEIRAGLSQLEERLLRAVGPPRPAAGGRREGSRR